MGNIAKIGFLTSAVFFGTFLPVEAALAQDSSSEVIPVGEIIVTATKESQSIQRVPSAITAISSDSIVSRGAVSLAGIQNMMPSVRLQVEGASTEIYIRGVGVTLDLPMIEAPSAFNINGIYVPRELSSASLFDVERMEALPGPQGTLYGRGALGGTINMITTRPKDDNATSLIFEAGNYDTFRGVLVQNLALSSDLRVRMGVSKHYHEGYETSGADSADETAGRLEISYTPSPNVDIYVWGQLEHKGGHPANLISKGTFSDPKSQVFPFDNPWNDTLTGPYVSYATLGPIDARDRDWDGVLTGAEINVNVSDALTLTYIPSYSSLDWQQQYWVVHKLTEFGAKIRQHTHELRLAYDNGGKFSWLAGLYGYRMKTWGGLQLQFGPDELWAGSPSGLWLDATDVQSHVLKGWAGFSQLTYHLSDDTRLVAGGRYSADKRTIFGYQPGLVDEPTLFNDKPNLNPTYQNSDDWSHADWKAGVEHDLSPDNMVYAFVQTASQPGTFDTFPDTMTKQSELMAFTVGTKNRLLDGRLILNNEFFYYDYKNLMTQAWDASNGSLRLQNADKTKIWGNQLDMNFRATSTTAARLNVGYLNTKYDKFNILGVDYSGNSLQSAPKWTVSLGLTQDFDLSNGGRLTAEIDGRFESGFWGDFAHSAGFYQDSYTKTDASISYTPPSENWKISLWVKNIEDTDVQASGGVGGLFDPGASAVFLEPPRTFGVRFSWKSEN